MREIKIVVEPFTFISLLKVECIKELNQHGVIMLRGIIEQHQANKYQTMAMKEIWVTVKLMGEGQEEKVFFNGILTELQIERENKVNILSLTVKTGSYLLDLTTHIRSFQNESFTYDEVIEGCVAPDSGKFIMLSKQGEKVNRFLVQYDETDWQFVKRLAGYANTVIIPEYTVPGRKMYFGYRNTAKIETIESEHYRLFQEYEKYQKRINKDPGNMTNSDLFFYEINSREVYGLGESVIFKGMELVIGKIISSLDGQELIHTYLLHTKIMGCPNGEEHKVIRGISLNANVVNVSKTKVFISIKEDENKRDTGNRWFDFATVYSTPDGTGWYCMPEIGDEVRLAFPDDCEGNAYVASCIHLEESRTNPEEKSWKNKQRKEILFTPDALILRNNKGMSVEIDDNEGIKIVSDKKIILNASQDINLNSDSGIQMSASDSMLLSQGGASIQMNDSITIGGGKIYMN